LRAPIPGQEFVDPFGGIIGKPGEDVGESSLRINIVERGVWRRV
jgi:hypothetical protein